MREKRYTLLLTGLVLLLVLGLVASPVIGVSDDDTYPVNVHRGTDITVYTDAQWGDEAYLANGDYSSTWTSLTPDDRLRFSFAFTNRVVIYEDFIHLGGEDQSGSVIDERDVSRYQLYAKDGADDDWTLVKEFSGSVTADGTPEASHNFSETPFTATAVRVEIIDRVPGDPCSDCDVPIAEGQLYGHTVDEDFTLDRSTTTSTTTTTTPTTEAPTPTTVLPTVSTSETEDDQSIFGSSAALLGGVGGVLPLGLGGFLVVRRSNEESPDSAPGAIADTDESDSPGDGDAKGTDQSESSGDDTPLVDTSRKESPKPSDADRDVADIAPGMAADQDLEDASEDGPAATEGQGAENQEETQSTDSEDASTAEPATTLDSLEESLGLQLESEEPAARIDAVETITTHAADGDIDDATAVDVLDHQLQTDANSEVRVAVIGALGSIGTDRAMSLLEDHRLDTDTAVSKAASEILQDLET